MGRVVAAGVPIENEPEAVMQMNFLVRRMNQAHPVGSTTTQCASRDEPSSSVIMQLVRPFLARQLSPQPFRE